MTLPRSTHADDVEIPCGAISLKGILGLPSRTRGVIVFAHGSGSSRLSPRNRYVTEELHAASLGTLLLDLLTDDEEADDALGELLRFDVTVLSDRFAAALAWAGAQESTCRYRIGCFGASTGAAAARQPEVVGAVVCRGGRPDLAWEALPAVRAPTLLIVGGADTLVREYNRAAQARLGGPSRLEVIPGASHLFEEPGSLAQVAFLARDWFRLHLAAA